MKFYNRNLYTKASLLLLIGYFLTFLFYYFSSFLFYDIAIFSYVWVFLQKSTYLLLPIIAALLTFIGYTYKGMKFALVRLIPLSLVRMIYFIPYYYLILIYNFFDSIESLSFAFIISIGECIATYALTLLLFYIMYLATKKKLKKYDTLQKAVARPTTLDFANPTSSAFIVISFIAFLYFFVTEVIDTVSILIEYSGKLTGGDIIYMVISYIFDASLLMLHYFILTSLKNSIVKNRVEEEVIEKIAVNTNHKKKTKSHKNNKPLEEEAPVNIKIDEKIPAPEVCENESSLVCDTKADESEVLPASENTESDADTENSESVDVEIQTEISEELQENESSLKETEIQTENTDVLEENESADKELNDGENSSSVDDTSTEVYSSENAADSSCDTAQHTNGDGVLKNTESSINTEDCEDCEKK